MAKQIINIGSGQNEGDGGDTRLAFEKINSNFDELYSGTVQTLTLVGTTLSISGGNQVTFDNVFKDGLTADVTGSVFADDSTLLVDGVNGVIPYPANGGVVWDGIAPTDVVEAIDRLADYTQNFLVSTPTDWNGTAPSSIIEAIDRLATVVKSLNSGTGA
jgi:hypothetical protein